MHTITSPLAELIGADTMLLLRASDAWVIVSALRAARESALADAISDGLLAADAGVGGEHPLDCGYCEAGEPMVHTYQPTALNSDQD